VDQVRGADAIVIAKVRSLSEAGEPSALAGDMNATLSVERYLKGAGPAEIVVEDSDYVGDPAFTERSIGQRYILLLKGESSPFKALVCAGRNLDQLGAEIAQETVDSIRFITGPGVPPQAAEPSETKEDSGFPWLPVVIAATASAGALGAAAAWLVRRASRG
jgi:hypothetical protein